MADGKKSFLLYCDIQSTINKLSDVRAGILFKTILAYVNDQNPIIEDEVLDLVFEPIKVSLKRDLAKYENIVHRNQQNGLLGGRPKKDEPKEPNGLIGNPKEPKEPKKADIDIDSDNVIDIDKEKDEEIIRPKFNFKKSLLALGVQPDIATDWMKVRKDKNASNTQTAFNAIKTQIGLSPLNPNDSIKYAVERSWQGFKAEWIKDVPNTAKSNKDKMCYFTSKHSQIGMEIHAPYSRYELEVKWFGETDVTFLRYAD